MGTPSRRLPDGLTRRDLSTRAAGLRTLLIFAALQAFLLSITPQLLSMWGEEAMSLFRASSPVGQILRLAHAGAQPPLYLLFLHGLLKLTASFDPLSSARVFSAMLVTVTTVLIDRLFLREAGVETRQWVLLLWTFSPCMLLFGRMAQPYALGALLTVIVTWSVLRFADEFSSSKRMAIFVLSLVALIYTQFVPGIAIWAGANALLWAKLRHDGRVVWTAWLIPNLLVAAACASWYFTAGAMPLGERGASYSFTGNVFLETALKIGYGTYSLAFGEAIPIWVLPLSMLLAGPLLWMIFRGVRVGREWQLPATIVVVAAYAGVAYSAPFPYTGERLLFLLPLMLMAIAAGIGRSGKIGTAIGVALFAASGGGVWSYFSARDFLNPAYVTPYRQFAASISFRSSPADTVIWIDGLNVDPRALVGYMPADFAVRVLRLQADVDAVVAETEHIPNIHHLWFICSPEDRAAGRVFEKLQQRLMGAWFSRTMRAYAPTGPVYRGAVKLLTHADPPRYSYEVWELRR